MSNTLNKSMEDLAWAIARIAHLGQPYHRAHCDWEYLTHVKRVVHNLGQVDEATKIVGILHDVVEDSDFSLEEIDRIFGKQIAKAVEALSRQEGEPYKDYIGRCAGNRIAKVVKGVDISDHILHCVKPDHTKEWKSLLKRYSEAIRLLHSL